MRAGTQDVRGALAFAAVARAACAALPEAAAEVSRRADRLARTLCAPGSGIVETTALPYDGSSRLPGIVSVMVPGLDSETLVLELDQAGFEVSAASACSSGSLDASHVLLAMGVPRESALGSLRVSFDERVAERDLERLGEALLDIVRDHARDRRRGRR